MTFIATTYTFKVIAVIVPVKLSQQREVILSTNLGIGCLTVTFSDSESTLRLFENLHRLNVTETVHLANH